MKINVSLTILDIVYILNIKYNLSSLNTFEDTGLTNM
jgi:hypothetical protein